MHGLCTYTKHNNETLEPLTWIWVRPSQHSERTLELLYCFVMCLYDISKCTTFKLATHDYFSSIIIAMVLTFQTKYSSSFAFNISEQSAETFELDRNHRGRAGALYLNFTT